MESSTLKFLEFRLSKTAFISEDFPVPEAADIRKSLAFIEYFVFVLLIPQQEFLNLLQASLL